MSNKIEYVGKNSLQKTVENIKNKVEKIAVIPNPEGEATENLEKIKIGDDIFKVEGGGSSIDLHIIGKNWSSTTEYSKNDFVVYDDKLWKSLFDNNLNNTPTEGLYWTETSIGDELKETDPTVPDWAKEPNKPSYNGTEIEYNNSETKFDATNVSEAIDELFTKTVGTVGTAVENYILLGEIPAWTSTVDLKGHRSFYLIGTYDGLNKLSRCCGGFYFDLDFAGQLRLLSDDERKVIYDKFYDQYHWNFYPMDSGWIRKEADGTYRCYWSSNGGYGTISLTVNEDGTVTVGQSYGTLGGIIVYKQSGIGNAYMTPFELTISDETNYGYLDADKNFHKFADSNAYIKPDDGIPKSDLNQSVQDSLDKADTALQSFTETDPTVPSHVKSITETDISNWNGKAEISDIPNVPSWALEETKPTYTASEVGALPDDTVIPEQLTEADILDMGFTKNTGTYIKPELGIPKSDLSEDVQNSLDKAETDPTVPEHVKSITETDISNWNEKQDKLTAGDNITIEDGVISASGGSGNANIWVGTQEEWDALDKSTIEDGTEVHITNDAGDVTYRLIKTYDDLMNNTSNNKLVDALVVKEIASHSGGASTWSEVAEKPFETIGQNLEVVNGVLNATGGGSAPENVVLLANEMTPSTPAPRDADMLGGVSASEYVKKTNIHNYSTDENVIGTWIDGKTLYEITIVSTNRPDGSEGCPVYDLSTLNIDSIANMFGAMYLDVKASRPVIMPLPSYIQHSNQIGLDIDATNKVAITMTTMWIQYIDHWVLTIQYTKL